MDLYLSVPSSDEFYLTVSPIAYYIAGPVGMLIFPAVKGIFDEYLGRFFRPVQITGSDVRPRDDKLAQSPGRKQVPEGIDYIALYIGNGMSYGDIILPLCYRIYRGKDSTLGRSVYIIKIETLRRLHRSKFFSADRDRAKIRIFHFRGKLPPYLGSHEGKAYAVADEIPVHGI